MPMSISKNPTAIYKFGEFTERDTIEFLCSAEFFGILELIAEMYGFSVQFKSSKQADSIIITSKDKSKIKLSSIEDNWSGDYGSDKFILTAIISKVTNFSYELLNTLNCQNVDLKFCVKSVSGASDKFLVISEMLNLKGGITVMNLISRLEALFFNQKLCIKALAPTLNRSNSCTDPSVQH